MFLIYSILTLVTIIRFSEPYSSFEYGSNRTKEIEDSQERPTIPMGRKD